MSYEARRADKAAPSLHAQRERSQRKEGDTGGSFSPLDRPKRLVLTLQRLIYGLARHWLALANSLALLYVGMPFLAPLFMKLGWSSPAHLLYTVYSPFCHQLAFRSWFLFGQQVVYPRDEFAALVGTADWLEARRFVGNETMGYKVALCQRDVAIYGALFLGGLLFALLRHRRRIAPLSLRLFFLIGILPIAADGGSQMLSYLLPFLPVRESTWYLRVITGALFGLSLAWLAYPNFEEGMADIRQTLEARYGWGPGPSGSPSPPPP
ncbi:MAG: DUF2085 domain-containing protein, partial [Chloroflexi bacterium]